LECGDLRKAIRKGDKFVAQVIEHAAEYLGVGAGQPHQYHWPGGARKAGIQAGRVTPPAVLAHRRGRRAPRVQVTHCRRRARSAAPYHRPRFRERFVTRF
jgi:hypothetical protein